MENALRVPSIDLIGKTLLDRFKVEELIGEGGNCYVFRGNDINEKQQVAVKVLKSVSGFQVDDLIRFKSEAAIVSTLNHHSIGKIFGVGEVNGYHYIIMEYIEGISLDRLLIDGFKIGWQLSLEIILQLAQVLEYVHNAGILHRDIKPSNIIVATPTIRDTITQKTIPNLQSGDISAKLIDFGLAQVVYSSLGMKNNISGTFTYMSPEQTGMLNKPVDERSDLYSMGVVFYQLLTGTIPFKGDSIISLLHQQVTHTPPMPHMADIKIPIALSNIVMKLINKDPQQRYQTAKGLLHDLKSVQKYDGLFPLGDFDRVQRIRFHTKLIGRDSEYKQLTQLFEDAQNGKGGICLIKGESGQGKSRLVQEFERFVVEHEGLFIGGKFFDQRNKSPFHAFSDAITQFFYKFKRFPASEQLQLRNRIRENVGDLGILLCRLNPHLRALFTDARELVQLTPESENNRFYLACCKFFASLGKLNHPTVLFIDDLQWADTNSITLLKELTTVLRTNNLIIIGAYRSEEVDEKHPLINLVSQLHHRDVPFKEINCGALTQKYIEEIVIDLFGNDIDWIPIVTKLVYTKCQGNAFHAFEIIRHFVREGIIVSDSNQWILNHSLLEHVTFSPSVLQNVHKRIDTLEQPLSEILCTASVIGLRFTTDILEQLCSFSKEEMILRIDTAISEQLIERTTVPGELSFTHDTIHEVFYQKIHHEQRRKLHLCIAEVFSEKVQVSSDPAYLFICTHHYIEAGDKNNILTYALPAAEEARKNFANEIAERNYLKVIELFNEKQRSGSSEWQRAMSGLADIYSLVGKHNESTEILTKLLDTASSNNEKADIYRRIGVNHLRTSDSSSSEKAFTEGLRFVGITLPNSTFKWKFSVIMEFLFHIPILFFPKLLFPRRQKRCDDSMKIAVAILERLNELYILSNYMKVFFVTLLLINIARKKLGRSPELARAISSYAVMYMAIPWFRRSCMLQEYAMKMKRELKDVYGYAQSLRWLGFTCIIQCDLIKAEHYFLQARNKFETIGDLYELTNILNGFQLVYFNRADLTKRAKIIEELHDYSSRTANDYCFCCAITSFGGSQLIYGNFDAAEQWIRKASDYCIKKKVWGVLCVSYMLFCQLRIEQGKYTEAIEYAEKGIQIEQRHSPTKVISSSIYPFLAEAYLLRYLKELHSWDSKKRNEEFRHITKNIQFVRKNAFRWPLYKGQSCRVVAAYYHIKGNTRKAKHYYQLGIRLLQMTGKRFELAKTMFAYAEFCKSLGKESKTSELYYHAYTMFRSIGAKKYTKKLEQLLEFNPNKTDSVLTHALISDRHLTSLIEISRSITSILDIDKLLQMILAKAVETTGAQHGFLFLRNEVSGKLELRLKSRADSENKIAEVLSHSIVESVYKSGKPLIVADAENHSDLRNNKSVAELQLKSIICVPITYRSNIIGACYLDNILSADVFHPKDIELLEMFMSQAAICIDNAKTYKQLKEKNEELKKDKDRFQKENISLKRLVLFNADHIRQFGGTQIVTQDQQMLSLIETSRKYGRTQANVLITGESGTGKELFAHLMHYSSDRHDKPCIKVNCSAIPETLFESEFFGAEKGSYTGAVKTKLGKFEIANGGTLFLDEIGELPLAQQAKLLRVLEEREITRLGGKDPIAIDIKVIAATNRDLLAMVKCGEFREDLYFRLNVLQIQIPPLAQRPNDIPVLATYFLSQAANEEGGREKQFDESALIYLRNQNFSGNIRELRNLVYRLYLIFNKEEITGTDIQTSRLLEQATKHAHTPHVPAIVFEEQPSNTSNQDIFSQTIPFNEFKEQIESHFLSTQLEKHNYNVSQTAKSLKLHTSALFRKIKQMDIKIEKKP